MRRTAPLGKVPSSFELLYKQFLKPLGKTVSKVKHEQESSEYGAIRFEMDGLTCLYRHAKHTPKKIGQFVTLWKRPTPSSEIAPFDCKDRIDLVFIFADEHPRFGVFIFQRQLLVKNNIFSKQSDGGKRAFRVYAPWTVPIAIQAKRSQVWQSANFIELTSIEQGRAKLVKML